MTEQRNSNRRTLQGRIVSDKMINTVTVLVERKVRHPVIGKIMIRSKKYHAHIEGLSVVSGDLVKIEECAPVSKTKSWKVSELLERAKMAQ